jgi:hypothetical protein
MTKCELNELCGKKKKGGKAPFWICVNVMMEVFVGLGNILTKFNKYFINNEKKKLLC